MDSERLCARYSRTMTRVTVLLNRGGGAVKADPKIGDKVAEALRAAGLDPDVELIEGGDCAVRAQAISKRGDELLVVGGGRSEERRVGKECRCRWWRDRYIRDLDREVSESRGRVDMA